MSKTTSNPTEKENPQECAVALIIFELDFTLWPFSVAADIIAPITKHKDKTIRDSTGSIIHAYPNIEKIFKKIHNKQIKIAIISHTNSPKIARLLIEAFGWKKYIHYYYIYHKGQKVSFLKKLHKKSGIEYTKMVSFENKEKNMADVQGLGIHCVLVKEGLNMQMFNEAIENFSKICVE